ncbi:MAG TPA: class I SAM-dependent methyltransferase [Methylophilus sp.]|nr:class I SAM-dependent methyltransferase [Methylophilus sp.]HQQ32957.1 class I SAM-dependent methyltransferase [Methylophilus sp.]
MKLSQGQIESGIEVGNHYNKYGSKNPIAQYLMRGFMHNLDDLVKASGQTEMHEIGCGEGVLSLRWLAQGMHVRACDFSDIAIRLAKENATQQGVANSIFEQKNIYDLTLADSAPLVVCCEVLEHLEFPELALQKLATIAQPWLIVSVPREPIWSFLNVMRGKYLTDFGNTPGHIQRWSKVDFIELVSQYFEVVSVRSPLPWTMLLCRAKGS